MKNRKKSSKADNRNNVIWDEIRLGSGSRVRSIVIDVNVKPLKRVKAFVTLDIY